MQWGEVCEAAISSFDQNHTAPKNIGSDHHPIYYFAAAKPKAYVMFVPPSGSPPISDTAGRWEYFLFQWLRLQNVAVFVLRVPQAGIDQWDHVPVHTNSSPYDYSCQKIKSTYDFCSPTCDMCMKRRSTLVIEAGIEVATKLGYTEQILMGWSSGGVMASAFLDHAHSAGFVTAHGTSYAIKGLALLSAGGQYCYGYNTISDVNDIIQWRTCKPTKVYGCCPENLTESYYWRNPHECENCFA